MNKVRGPRDPPSQWPPGLRFPDKEICSPGPYSSQRGLFPLLSPSPPTQPQDLHRLLRGDPPPRLAFSAAESGEELGRSEQVKTGELVLGGLGKAQSLHSLRSWGSGCIPLPYLTSATRSRPSIGSHLLPRVSGSSRTGCLCEVK